MSDWRGWIGPFIFVSAVVAMVIAAVFAGGPSQTDLIAQCERLGGQTLYTRNMDFDGCRVPGEPR